MAAARYACVFSFGLLSAAALGQTGSASTVSDQQAEAPAAQVLVSGKRPGPGLWKVSKDGHVMWVFGMVSPLPSGMAWDDGRVDRLIAQSQEVLEPPRAGLGIGFLGGLSALTALPSLIGLKKNPDGAQLHDVLPADVYARWSVLKQKYVGEDDGVERYRPFFAAQELMQAGLEKSGLSGGIEVRKQIEGLAKKRKVKLSETGFITQIEDAGSLLKEFRKSQMEDVSCFTKTLERFEGDLDATRTRANAWANGNIAEIGKLDYAEREDACHDAVLSSPAARKHPAFQNLRERRLASWLNAVEKSLAANASTVAMLPMSDIIGPKSYLAELQARGYTVESPR